MCLGSELLLLRAFELWFHGLLGFGIVSEKSDVSLVFVHFLFLYFDSVFIWMDFVFRYLFIVLRILCMLTSCVFGNIQTLLFYLKDNLAVLNDKNDALFSYNLVAMSSLTPGIRNSYREDWSSPTFPCTRGFLFCLYDHTLLSSGKFFLQLSSQTVYFLMSIAFFKIFFSETSGK